MFKFIHAADIHLDSPLKGLEQYEGAPADEIRGNHDAANKMTKSLPLPDNVEMLWHSRPQTAKSKTLEALGVAMHGVEKWDRSILCNLWTRPCCPISRPAKGFPIGCRILGRPCTGCRQCRFGSDRGGRLASIIRRRRRLWVGSR